MTAERAPEARVVVPTPKLTKLDPMDDVKAYLTTFERLMATYGVEEAKWVYTLAAFLTGKAQQAFATLYMEQAKDYQHMKAAISRDITLHRRCANRDSAKPERRRGNPIVNWPLVRKISC